MNAIHKSCFSLGTELLESRERLPSLELNSFLVPQPTSSLFVQAVGDQMSGAGVLHDDLLVVDRAKEARSGNLVALQLAEGLTICRLLDDGVHRGFQQEGRDGATFAVEADRDQEVFGVVTWVLHHT